MNEFDARPVSFIESDARFTGVNLGFDQIKKLVQRGFTQIDGFREFQVITLCEVMPQRRIYFGFAARRVEDVAVANAFLFREFHRDEQQGRMDAFQDEKVPSRMCARALRTSWR